MSKPILDPQAFLAGRQWLEHPSATDLREAFTALPKRGFLEALCAWDRRLELQRILEASGGFSITMEPTSGCKTVRLSAYKGKVGPCYETGRSATYEGLAAAVLDDDGHLIAGTIRVCEKTGSIYTLPPYRDLITVSEADPALLQRLESNPLPFDCNTFEADARRLATSPTGEKPNENTPRKSPEMNGSPSLTTVLYPGPFRLLILRDGAMLRRGLCYRLPDDQARALAARDHLLLLPAGLAGEAQIPEMFPTAFAQRGPRCLLEEAAAGAPVADSATPAPVPVPQDAEMRASAALTLCTFSPEMKQRLLSLLENQDAYFILTGSDPGEPMGCCPNDLVGEANKLVAAGVLARNQVPAAPDACTNTIYAFAGEISGPPERPVFQVNEVMRRQALALLREPPSEKGRRRRLLLQLLVAILIIMSLVLAVRRVMPLSEAAGNLPLNQALDYVLQVAPQKPRVVVCFFKNEHECDPPCTPLLEFTKKTLDQWFAPELADGTIMLKVVNGDTPENQIIRPHLNGAMTTIGLVSYSTGEPEGWRLLTNQVYRVFKDEPAFSAMLRDEIRQMLKER